MYLGHIFITGPRQTIFLHSPPLIWGKFPLQIKIQVLGFESEYSKLDARTKNSLILSQNVKYGTFVATVTKNLTYALWENNSGSNSLRESSASCEGLPPPSSSAAALVVKSAERQTDVSLQHRWNGEGRRRRKQEEQRPWFRVDPLYYYYSD